MRLSTSVPAIAASVLLSAAAAYAAPVAQLSCKENASGTSISGNSGDLQATVGYFDIGIMASIGSQSSGAGAGKVTFQTANLHVSLSKFPEFYKAVIAGGALESCTLQTKLQDGTDITYDFKLVSFQSVTAIASSAHDPNQRPAEYTALTLEYGGLAVRTNSGADDGGTAAEPVIKASN